MKNLFYYPFIYSVILVVLGTAYSLRQDKKIWIFVSAILSIAINVLTVHFLIINIGRKLAFDRFEFTPLIYSSYISIAIALGSLILWKVSKSWFPALLILILSLAHIGVVWFLKFYFLR